VLGGKRGAWPELKNHFVQRIGSWAEVVAQAKTVLAIKPHFNNALNRPDDALWLVEQVNNPFLQLAFDFSHFGLAGDDLTTTLQRLVPHSRFIHVKDWRGTSEKFEFLLPGDGSLNYVTYFQQLRALKYSGPVVVEVSAQVSQRAGYDPVAAAKKCYTILSAAMEQAGLAVG